MNLTASIYLGTPSSPGHTQLHGLKTRKLRVVANQQRDIFLTEWRPSSARSADSDGASVLLLGQSESHAAMSLARPGMARSATRNQAAVIAVAVARSGHQARCALPTVEQLLGIAQITPSQRPVWLLTASGLEHAGAWGLSRSVRCEVQVRMGCICACCSLAELEVCLEPEVIVHPRGQRLAPRLCHKMRTTSNSAVQLSFHARGALSALFIEPQPHLSPSKASNVLIRARAVGLNFRDVLNVLGEYPGDPGPPGSDAGGVVSGVSDLSTSKIGAAVFGFCSAPFASVTSSSAWLLTGKPAAFSFEQASTLPIAWSTTHAALERGHLSARCGHLIHAAAGGVGCKAIEYTLWLGARAFGTVGRPDKHSLLHMQGVDLLNS